MKTRRRENPGIALTTVLLFVPILLIMVIALFLAVRGSLFTSQVEYCRTQALFLAEAGVADVMSMLDADPAWTAGVANKSLPGLPGTYSVTFNTNPAGPFTQNDSVNNSDGAHPNSYRGNSSVPPGGILLVVSAQVSGHERQLEVILEQGGGLANLEAPLVTTGKIKLFGNVSVDGVTSLTDSTPVAGDIHSNQGGGSPGLITWTPSGGAATITGKVSTVGTNSSAIDLATCVPAGGTQVGAASQAIPPVDIVGQISAKSGATQPSVPASGPMTLASGDYYLPAGATLNGDLQLADANLYVAGDLHVNGSIGGKGSVYVQGETHFKGDSSVTAANPDQTALFSNGSVFLTGFDGTQYLNALAASNPAIQTTLDGIKTSMADLSAKMSSPTPGDFGSGNLLEQMRGELGAGATPRAGHQANQLATMVGLLNAEPPSPSRDFLLQRFNYLNDVVFYNFGSGELAALDSDQVVAGVYDEIFDGDIITATPYLPKLVAFVDNIDYNRIGSSQFQGLVYTHGFVYSDNEVTVRGALVARSNGSQSSQVVGSQTLNPGDVYLGDGSRLTYVKDFFSSSATSGTGGWTTSLWMGR